MTQRALFILLLLVFIPLSAQASKASKLADGLERLANVIDENAPLAFRSTSRSFKRFRQECETKYSEENDGVENEVGLKLCVIKKCMADKRAVNPNLNAVDAFVECGRAARGEVNYWLVALAMLGFWIIVVLILVKLSSWFKRE